MIKKKPPATAIAKRQVKNIYKFILADSLQKIKHKNKEELDRENNTQKVRDDRDVFKAYFKAVTGQRIFSKARLKTS